MKSLYFLYSILAIVGFSCNNNEKAEPKDQTRDTTKTDSLTTPEPAPVAGNSPDSVVVDVSAEILNALDQKDYTHFAEFIHPQWGVRFSPYGYIDTMQDKKITKEQFLQFIKSKNKIKWGVHDGSGEDINMDILSYLKKFVYDVKFVNPEVLSFNQTLAKGNSLNNQSAVYPNLPYTESYFSGFEKKYDGMDWRSLRLIYKKEGDKYFLVAVVHDQWTI